MNSVTSVVAAVIEDPAGRVLLCQQSQGHRMWGLPGGRIRPGESPIHAAVRDIREETGTDIDLVDLVGLYTLTGPGTPAAGQHQTNANNPFDASGNGHGAAQLPDVVIHVFRARLTGEATLNAPGRICRLGWYDAGSMPEPITASARWAVVDARAGRSGVLRVVVREPEPAPVDDELAPASA